MWVIVEAPILARHRAEMIRRLNPSVREMALETKLCMHGNLLQGNWPALTQYAPASPPFGSSHSPAPLSRSSTRRPEMKLVVQLLYEQYCIPHVMEQDQGQPMKQLEQGQQMEQEEGQPAEQQEQEQEPMLPRFLNACVC